MDAVIILFVPPVVAGAEEVAEAIRHAVDGMEALDKPVLAVVMSGAGTPRPCPPASGPSRGSTIPSRRPLRWAARPTGPTGCVVPRARCRSHGPGPGRGKGRSSRAL